MDHSLKKCISIVRELSSDGEDSFSLFSMKNRYYMARRRDSSKLNQLI